MELKGINSVYFVGIGGIGMSALARYFNARGVRVCGYDRIETGLTLDLVKEGISVHYDDNLDALSKDAQLVVYTPAIPADHKELNWYRANNYPVFKRSDVLQWISQSLTSVTVAGTHGKTTVSTMTAYLLRETGHGCNAFLGGISVNYGSNYWSSPKDTVVIEADEYDRSFLKLNPSIAVLTAIDPDHLDIYGTAAQMEDAFIQYTRNIQPGGTLLVKHGLHRAADLHGPTTITYGLGDTAADVYTENIIMKDGSYTFDVVGPTWQARNMKLNIGGMHNVENAMAAIAVTQLLGIDIDLVRTALAGFKGVKRRFEYVIKNERIVFIDDYAHHPAELAALIGSARALFPERRCVVAFQPHLFSRTRDFADGFAQSLDMADEVLMLDIYPARELPMEGITSASIADRMKNPAHRIVSVQQMLDYVKETPLDMFIISGAGDIDKLVKPVKEILENK